MKRFFIFFSFMFLCLYSFSEDKKIAILEIENSTSRVIDTKFITESVQMEVVSKKYFTVVERKMLNKILEEKKLSLSGLTAEEKAAQVGLLAGAESIWIGSVTMLDDVYVITVKSLDTKSGVIEYADQVYCKSESDFLDVIPVLVERLYRKSKGENVEKFTSKDVKFKSKTDLTSTHSGNEEYSIGYKEGMLLGKKSGNSLYFIGGCLIPYGLGLILPLIFDPQVPLEHTIGKSSSYVIGFTAGYKKAAKDANFGMAMAGCLTQLAFYVVYYVVVIATAANSTSSY